MPHTQRFRIVLATALLSTVFGGCARQTPTPGNPNENPSGGAGIGGATPTPAGSVTGDVVTFFGVRTNVLVGQPFEVTWRVQPAEKDATLTATYLHYDTISHPGSFGPAVTATDAGYTSIATNFAKTSDRLPRAFTMKVPATRTGTLYMRAHAVIGGKNYWSSEVKVVVMTPDELRGSQTSEPNPSEAPEAIGVSFSMTAKNWEFSPNVLRVKKGNSVVISITNTEGAHGFVLPDFSIDEKLVPGQSVTVKLFAYKSGEFTFSCGVPCGSEHQNMKGTLIVEP
ncbi:MAG: cupredoxin domain-containing protein [Patescibacteria group bacterium]|nr:cupredoxin domain-containing protein [Patescibacteria group bacterium]